MTQINIQGHLLISHCSSIDNLKSESGEQEADFIQCIVWRKQAGELGKISN